ncbi:MAG: recombinase family protein [Mailhella sp.]|nr:recombinase family protein [Mailhella sp.]
MCKPAADIAYIRVSTVEQNTDRQLAGLTIDKTFEDHCSGKDTDRPALRECLAFLRSGDTLHVHSIDRLARNLADLQSMVEDLNAKGIAVRFHKEQLVFAGKKLSPMNKLMFQMLGAFAEFERATIRERQAEGIAKAKERGAYKGRKATITAEIAQTIRERRAAGEKAADLAKEYGVTRETIYAACRK